MQSHLEHPCVMETSSDHEAEQEWVLACVVGSYNQYVPFLIMFIIVHWPQKQAITSSGSVISISMMSASAISWFTGPWVVWWWVSSMTGICHRLKMGPAAMSTQEWYHSWRWTFSQRRPSRAKWSTCTSTSLNPSSGSKSSVFNMRMESSWARTDHSITGLQQMLIAAGWWNTTPWSWQWKTEQKFLCRPNISWNLIYFSSNSLSCYTWRIVTFPYWKGNVFFGHGLWHSYHCQYIHSSKC